MEKIEHTPIPWAVFEHADHSGLQIGPPYPENDILAGNVRDVCGIRGSHYHPEYKRACAVDDLDRANAAFIVRACNSFDALLDACKALQRWSWTLPLVYREADQWKAIDASIHQAEQGA